MAKELGISSENIAKMENQITKAASKGSKFTEPTLQKGGKPKGNYAKPDINDPRPINRQNQTAELFAKKGYDVQMLPDTVGGNGYGIKSTSSPDYLINGEPFDCYSPKTNNLYTIYGTIEKKAQEQTGRIIINIDDYPGTIDSIVQEFFDYDVPGLEELIITRGEEIIRIFIK